MLYQLCICHSSLFTAVLFYLRLIVVIYHFLYLSNFDLLIVYISTVCISFIQIYECHTVITEFAFCPL
jgi:hypothetical protein